MVQLWRFLQRAEEGTKIWKNCWHGLRSAGAVADGEQPAQVGTRERHQEENWNNLSEKNKNYQQKMYCLYISGYKRDGKQINMMAKQSSQKTFPPSPPTILFRTTTDIKISVYGGNERRLFQPEATACSNI